MGIRRSRRGGCGVVVRVEGGYTEVFFFWKIYIRFSGLLLLEVEIICGVSNSLY